MNQIATFLMFVMMATIVHAQEGDRTPHHYENVEVNGVMIKKYVSDHKPSIELDQRNKVRDTFNYLERVGFVDALNDLSVQNLSNISSSLELRDYQQKDVAKLLNEFRREARNAKTDSDRQAIVVKFSTRLKDQLLPGQLGGLLSKRMLFSRIALTDVGDRIELTDAQRKRLVAECGNINETLVRLQKEQTAAKERMQHIYDSVLTEDQRKQLAKELNVPTIISEMSLQEMEQDTRFRK